MFRPFLAILAILAFACCAPLAPSSDTDPFFSSSSRGLYTVRVINWDYDAKNLWVYCDGTQSLVMRGFAAGEQRTERLRDSDCLTISFRTEGYSGRELYRSPKISIPTGGTIEITLTEYPAQTHWRTDVARRTSG